MGIFITCLVAVVIVYFVQLGLRRGVYPVVISLVVVLLAFLIAMDWRLQMAHLLARWVKWVPQDQVVAGYLALFLFFFLLLGFLLIKYSPEIAPLYLAFDRVAGALLGVIAGLGLCGALAYAWFDSTLAVRYPIPANTIYVKPHEYLLHLYARASGHLPPAKPQFDAVAVIADMRGKGTAMPWVGDGFWVSSVPTELRAFVDGIRGQPMGVFKGKLDEWLRSGWEQGQVASGPVPQGLMGKTPALIRSDARTVLVAVETILPPGIPDPAQSENPLADDGQIDTHYFSGDGKRHFVKIYRLTKQTKTEKEVPKVIALMHLKDASDQDVENLTPKDERYTLKNPENARAGLLNDGLPDALALKIIQRAKRAGKVQYKTKEGRTRILVIVSPDGEFEFKDSMP